jgi:hypothetical protein
MASLREWVDGIVARRKKAFAQTVLDWLPKNITVQQERQLLATLMPSMRCVHLLRHPVYVPEIYCFTIPESADQETATAMLESLFLARSESML